MITPKDRERLSKTSRSAVEAAMLRHIDRYNNILYGIQISKDLFSFDYRRIKDRVDKLTELIENELYNIILNGGLYNIDNEEDEGDIYIFMNRDRDGNTLSSFIKEYVGVFNSEIEAYIESSLYFGISVSEGLGKLKAGLKNAYSTDFIKEAYDKIEKPNSPILKAKGMTVKKGEYKTSLANLKRLAWFTVIEALTYRQVQSFVREGAVGYSVHRGSSYPCEYCDSFLGEYSFDDLRAMPPQHGSCYCYILPVYEF